MTDRSYRILVGLAILLALYFDLFAMMYFLIVVMLLEGITRWSVPMLIGKVGERFSMSALAYHPEPCHTQPRINFDGELMWRLVVAVMVLLTYSFTEYFWFFPWFMGLTILGAGVSGVCPILSALRWIGFK